MATKQGGVTHVLTPIFVTDTLRRADKPTAPDSLPRNIQGDNHTVRPPLLTIIPTHTNLHQWNIQFLLHVYPFIPFPLFRKPKSSIQF
jgi:hypothetical protein